MDESEKQQDETMSSVEAAPTAAQSEKVCLCFSVCLVYRIQHTRISSSASYPAQPCGL